MLNQPQVITIFMFAMLTIPSHGRFIIGHTTLCVYVYSIIYIYSYTYIKHEYIILLEYTMWMDINILHICIYDFQPVV